MAEDEIEDERWTIQNSEEIEAIPFEWTPEFVRLSSSRRQIHPFLGPIGEWPHEVVPPDALPDPADTRECLKWFGLSDEKITQVERKFKELYPNFQSPICGYEERYSFTGRNIIRFPILDKMVKVFYGMVDHWNSDFEYTHEGYIKKGIQQGLRPEFAVFCGMHKDDPRCIEYPGLFEKEWFDSDPTSRITEFMESFWIILKRVLANKLIREGKAWSNDHGQWLVHKGEDLEQAKSRVNALDLDQLHEQAKKEQKEYWARKKEEQDRLIDLDVAEPEAEFQAQNKGE